MPRRAPLPPYLSAFVAYLLDEGLSPSSSARYAAEVGRFLRARTAADAKVTGEELWQHIRVVGASNPQALTMFCAGWPRFVSFAGKHGQTYPPIPTKAERDRQWREAAFSGLEDRLATLALRIAKAPQVLAGLRWDRVSRTESGFSQLDVDGRELVVAPDATEALDAIRAAQPAGAAFVMQTLEGRALSSRDIVGLFQWAGAPLEDEIGELIILPGAGR
jgi:hypothetical protein